VRLFLNGEELGSKEIPRWGHLTWKVKYQPGTLLARGWKNGKVAVETKVETTGEPASIQLRPYQTRMHADGEDTMPVEVSILDAKGRLVPTAFNQVTFEVSGPGEIAGVGNGNPSSHEPDKAKKRRAFHGLCAAFVHSGEKPGIIRLTAKSQGLKSASITLRAL
jgi:beta-galactosidase